MQITGNPCTPSEIAKHCGKSTQAIYNMLQRMMERGIVEKSASPGKYRLAPNYPEGWDKV